MDLLEGAGEEKQQMKIRKKISCRSHPVCKHCYLDCSSTTISSHRIELDRVLVVVDQAPLLPYNGPVYNLWEIDVWSIDAGSLAELSGVGQCSCC